MSIHQRIESRGSGPLGHKTFGVARILSLLAAKVPEIGNKDAKRNLRRSQVDKNDW